VVDLYWPDFTDLTVILRTPVCLEKGFELMFTLTMEPGLLRGLFCLDLVSRADPAAKFRVCLFFTLSLFKVAVDGKNSEARDCF